MAGRTFRDRQDAARQLAEQLKEFELNKPVVLGIPRGGVVTAAMLARELDAEMDVALARKLRHPMQPELAIGAIAEDGEVYLEPRFRDGEIDDDYLEQEKRERLDELQRRQKIFRQARPPAAITGRTVLLTDDGIATGSTMFAALQAVKGKQPHQTILAVPVAPASRFEQFQRQADHAIAVHLPDTFMAIGQFYQQFDPVSEEQACDLLRQFAP